MSQVEASPEEKAELVLQEEQRMIRLLAVASVAFWGVDVLVVERVPWDTLALRGVWAGLMGLCAEVLGRVSRPRRRWVRLLVGAVLPSVVVAALSWRLGGVASPVFAWMCTLPLATLSVMHGSRSIPLVTTGCAMVAALGVMVASGLSPAWVGAWLLSFLASGVIAVQSAGFYRQLHRAQAESEASRQEAQEALAASRDRVLQAERMAQVGRLAAGVAHEVNNPLAYIQSNLRYLMEEWDARQANAREVAEALQETVAGVERIRQIVQDLTAYSRSTEAPEEVAVCPLPAVIEESVRLASVRMRRMAVVVDVPRELPAVRADPRRLSQVLLNLLLNSADALEEAQVAGGRVALRVVPEAARVRVVLEDNGPGISAEHLPRLFTPFFTTKAPGKGTGLGLALSRQYVERFGGSLCAENRPEGGARFTVELPAV